MSGHARKIDWSQHAKPECPDCNGTGEVDYPQVLPQGIGTKLLCECVPSAAYITERNKLRRPPSGEAA